MLIRAFEIMQIRCKFKVLFFWKKNHWKKLWWTNEPNRFWETLNCWYCVLFMVLSLTRFWLKHKFPWHTNEMILITEFAPSRYFLDLSLTLPRINTRLPQSSFLALVQQFQESILGGPIKCIFLSLFAEERKKKNSNCCFILSTPAAEAAEKTFFCFKHSYFINLTARVNCICPETDNYAGSNNDWCARLGKKTRKIMKRKNNIVFFLQLPV